MTELPDAWRLISSIVREPGRTFSSLRFRAHSRLRPYSYTGADKRENYETNEGSSLAPNT